MSAGECIALFDENGHPTGCRERTHAYANGERVGLVFVWSAWWGSEGRAKMLLQMRSRPGDPFLGCLDAPAGGHIRAGEEPAHAARREFFEEVGIRPVSDEMYYLGRLNLNDQYGDRMRRAVQFFYLYTRPIDLRRTEFSEEVQAFAEVELDDFDMLVNGGVDAIPGRVRSAQAACRIVMEDIRSANLTAYSEIVMDGIRRSVRCLQMYFNSGRIDGRI